MFPIFPHCKDGGSDYLGLEGTYSTGFLSLLKAWISSWVWWHVPVVLRCSGGWARKIAWAQELVAGPGNTTRSWLKKWKTNKPKNGHAGTGPWDRSISYFIIYCKMFPHSGYRNWPSSFSQQHASMSVPRTWWLFKPTIAIKQEKLYHCPHLHFPSTHVYLMAIWFASSVNAYSYPFPLGHLSCFTDVWVVYIFWIANVCFKQANSFSQDITCILAHVYSSLFHGYFFLM